jgi:hypothetical protein
MTTNIIRLRIAMLEDLRRVLRDAAGQPVVREIEVAADRPLESLARAIVRSFGFDFDHAFGFYSGGTSRSLLSAQPCWESFADMPPAPGEHGRRAGSVRRTAVAAAFPAPGSRLTFLFDYGDEWLFRVEAVDFGQAVPRRRYPRISASSGKAPPQYPAEDDEPEEPREIIGINPRTGERIVLKLKPKPS